MPGFDGTGPRGLGPMTGGCRGYCVLPVKGSNSPNQSRKPQGLTGIQGRPVSAAYPYRVSPYPAFFYPWSWRYYPFGRFSQWR